MPQTQPQNESRQANQWHIVSGASEICSDIAVCGHSVVTTATVSATCIHDILQVQICSGTMIYCHHIFLSIMANGRRLRTNTNTT